MNYQQFRDGIYKHCKDKEDMLALAKHYLDCNHDNKTKVFVSCHARFGDSLAWQTKEVASKDIACKKCIMQKENERPLFVEDNLPALVNVYFLEQ